MIIVMKKDVDDKIIADTKAAIERFGLVAHISQGKEKTVIGAVGSNAHEFREQLLQPKGVEEIVAIQKPYKIVSREFQAEDSIIDVGGVPFGGKRVQMIAGPCTVESRESLLAVATEVKRGGALLMRGGAFKPRTSPYAFQGLGEEGLKYLAEARDKTGLKIVTEVLDTRDVELVAKYADVFQIGARNMQNFRLLQEVGHLDKPVLLKRGLSATLMEWLMSAEYIASNGNRKIILCERGIRTYETATRNTLDLSAIPVMKHLTHLPIVVDPSHALGKWDYIPSMCRAAVAAGADGLLLEVHPDPAKALCDGPQALRMERFSNLMKELKAIASVIGRTL